MKIINPKKLHRPSRIEDLEKEFMDQPSFKITIVKRDESSEIKSL
jgi:hypothetical protein